ncbi:MAG: hypothetical protein EOO08_00300 [Chitinophagaceae bacterium]|nr:MAG: hypothetical protein EOO08_00300 [Chitinophagaceae bacterium]
MQQRTSRRFLVAAFPALLAVAAFTVLPPLRSGSSVPATSVGCDSTPSKPAVRPFKDQRNRPFMLLVPMRDSAGRLRYLLDRPGDGC